MKQCQVIQELETGFLKSDIPDFRVGDTVSIHTKIKEGEKERLQVFTGTVIARKGSGLSETFSIYRVSYGSGMERVFLLNSPRIAKIEIVKIGKVRKSKLYYLRGVSGKAAKVKEYIGPNKRAKTLSANAAK
ncbi:MAG: 50S ribosomal protein L19 [Chlamydiae bacterium]|nr:50S ribosomal protein L19 [Chlamydiota bacterium]